MRKPLLRGVFLVVLIATATAGIFAQTLGVHPLTGRRFAGVTSYQGASWLDREERDIEEAPDQALDAIGAAEDAARSARGAEAHRAHGAPGVQEGRSVDPDPPRT